MQRFVLILFFFATISAFAQDLQFFNEGKLLQNGDTLSYITTIEDLYSENDILIPITIKNVTEKTFKVFANRTTYEAVCTSYICFGGCHPPHISQNIEAVTFLPGQQKDSVFRFHVEFGLEITGYCSYMFRFFDVNNPELSMILYFNVLMSRVGVNENNSNKNFLSCYPNPINQNQALNVRYFINEPANLVIRNSVGSVIYSVQLDSQKEEVPVRLPNMPAGIYFYSLETKWKRLATHKLVVK